MRPWIISLLMTMVGVSAAGVQPASSERSVRAEDLGWLAGCWTHSGGGTKSEEHWMSPAGGMLLGMSRTMTAGKVSTHEFIRIAEDAQGQLVFVARPSDQPEASFRLMSQDAHRLVFENPQHDFPQRIIYALAEDGHLAARIEGKSGGQDRGMDFPFKRIACPEGGQRP
jgi:hypothetical protein